MSNSYFKFKRFTVHHDLCAMKVGTDGVLLGAWATGGQRVLDVGCGSGLIALCMAQRFPTADVTAIDVDEGACRQTAINAEASPFANRITVKKVLFQQLCNVNFDAIVCNPPFFKDSLKCPDPQRTLARHASSLTAFDLMHHAVCLLTAGGTLSVIIPTALRADYDSEALFAGLTPSRAYRIKTVSRKPAGRCLLEYRKGSVSDFIEQQICLNDDSGERSEWYRTLTEEFYL